jgi:hypothetical protein
LIFVILQKNWHTTYNSYCESLLSDIHSVCNFVCGYVNYRDSIFFVVRHIYLCSIQGNCNFLRITVKIVYIYRGFNIICGCINYREIVVTIFGIYANCAPLAILISIKITAIESTVIEYNLCLLTIPFLSFRYFIYRKNLKKP